MIYQRLVVGDDQLEFWKSSLLQHIFHDDENFARRMQALIDDEHLIDGDIPKQQRWTDQPLATWFELADSREHGLYLAHKQGGKTRTGTKFSGVTISKNLSEVLLLRITIFPLF